MKLIKLKEDHYIVVDNSLDFSETDYYWDDKQKEIRTGSNNHVTGGYKIKITHSNIGHLYQDSILPLSLQEVKELLGEVDVEKKAKENYVEPLNKQGEKRAQLVGNGGLFGFNKFKKAFKKGYTQAIEDNKEKKYTRNEVHMLMCKAFEQGWKKADVVEAGLEGLETDVECAWILTRHDSTPTPTEWEVDIINGKITLKQ